MELSKTDYTVIDSKDSEYFAIKARLYKRDEDYKSAKEYYNLAIALGDIDATAELGELYLDIEKEVDLALAYLQIAASSNSILAFYKLGKIYNEGKFVEEDKELGHYYYSKALDELSNYDEDERVKYPSLHLDIAKDIIENNESMESLFQAYDYLEIANDGFVFALNNGLSEYADKLKETQELLDSELFQEIKEIMKSDDCDCDGECHCHED